MENMPKDSNALCKKEGIMHEFVLPYTLQLNGTTKRENRNIMNTVRSMLSNKHLPNELWVRLCRLQHTS